MTKRVTGDIDIAAEWETYLSQLETLGASQLLEMYQTAYDARAGG